MQGLVTLRFDYPVDIYVHNDSADALCRDVLNILGNGLQTLHYIVLNNNRTQLISDFGLNASQVVSNDDALLWAYSDLITPIGQAAVRNTLKQDVCKPLNDSYYGETDQSAYDSIRALYLHLQTLPKLPISSAWVWQSCRELGFFQTTYPGSNQPFSVFEEFSVTFLSSKACTGDFVRNASMPSTYQINRDNGGLQIESTVPNITFINGCRDPWCVYSIVLDCAHPPFADSIYDKFSHHRYAHYTGALWVEAARKIVEGEVVPFTFPDVLMPLTFCWQIPPARTMIT